MTAPLLDILQEKKRRLAARRSLAGFTEYVMPGTVPAEHHRLLIDKLEAIERGDIKRLMIFMPPGSAKSTYAGILFPSWYLGRHPGHLIIGAGYNQDIAERNSKRTRNTVAGTEFGRLFDARLSGDSASVSEWETTESGGFKAAGVGSGITGRRAHGALIDDPVKGREEADSKTIREKTVAWYKEDLWTRLLPGAWQILIMTRWHEEDLAGWLLSQAAAGGQQWEVLRLPMEAEGDDPLGRSPGERLWPDWFTDEMVTEAKTDARRWSALYQQRPTPEEGHFFRKDWIRWYDDAPRRETLRIYGASDYAVTAGGGDYTVHGVAGLDANDDLWLLDWWRAQTDSATWVDALIGMIGRWRPIEWGEEADQIAKSLGPFIDKRVSESNVYCYRRPLPHGGADKAAKAQAIRGRLAQGKVYLPRNAPWAADLIAEMLTFPAGRNDDQVDVLSVFGRMLSEMAGPRAHKPAPPQSTADYNPHDWARSAHR